MVQTIFSEVTSFLIGVIDSSQRATIGDHRRDGWAPPRLDLFLHRGMETGPAWERGYQELLESGPIFEPVSDRDGGGFFSKLEGGPSWRRCKDGRKSLPPWKWCSYFRL